MIALDLSVLIRPFAKQIVVPDLQRYLNQRNQIS